MYKFEDLKRKVEEGADPVIALHLEDDSYLYCGIKAIFQMEDRDYIAFYPVTEGDPEVFFARVCRTEEDDAIFEDIEDDMEYFKVTATYAMLFDQQTEEEEHNNQNDN